MNEMYQIRAVYDDKTIRIYQAYNDKIADEAIKNGTFGKSFNRERMTWIKPSFLWMMYRSGWAKKENQERILAIDIKREAFDFIVEYAVPSMFDASGYVSIDDWKKQVKDSSVRIQWDPERDQYGSPLEYRSIQLGIRGDIVDKYVDEWIVKMTDITEYVTELKLLLDNKNDIADLLPKERTYSYFRNFGEISDTNFASKSGNLIP